METKHNHFTPALQALGGNHNSNQAQEPRQS